MKNSMRRLALLTVSGGLLVTGAALAQEQPGQDEPQGQQERQGQRQQQQGGSEAQEPGEAPAGKAATRAPLGKMAELITVRATVENIDRKGRKLTLRDQDGQKFNVQVPSEVTGLEKAKKGDEIDLRYYQSMAVSLLPSDMAAPRAEERVVGTRQMGGGGLVREISAALTVSNVDLDNNKITFKAPDGSLRTVHVADPAAQRRLRNISPGDVVEVTFTEAVAASIEPKGEQGQGQEGEQGQQQQQGQGQQKQQ